MNKEKKRLLIIFAVLLSAAVYCLYDAQQGPYSMPKAPQVMIKPADVPLTPLVATQQAPVVEAPEVRTERAWGRDPFQPPEGIELVKKTIDETQNTQQQMERLTQKVTCIFIKGSQKWASIGGKNYSTGEMVGDESIVDILQDRVILKKGMAKRELLLESVNMSVLKRVK